MKQITLAFFLALVATPSSVLVAQWIQTAGPYGGRIQALLSSPNGVQGTNLFAGTVSGGGFLSTNNGTSWTAVNEGLPGYGQYPPHYDGILCLAVSGRNLFAGTYYGGVLRSTDNGTSWTAVNNGFPKRIKVDNGPEFISKDLDRWAYWNKVELDFSRPGRPSDNALVEAFNSRFRQECLNQHWFMSLEDARVTLAAWQHEYNTDRPHSSLGYRSPIQSESKPTNEEATAA